MHLCKSSGWFLDAACGTGTMIHAFENCGFLGKLLMVDASRKMVRRSRDRCRESAVEAHAVLGDVSRLPLKNGCLEGVACIFSLTTISRPVRALGEFLRSLQADGGIVILDNKRPSSKRMRILYSALVPISRCFCHTYIDRDLEGYLHDTEGLEVRTRREYIGGMAGLYVCKKRSIESI